MLTRRHSSGYNFIGDTENGITMRWGQKLNINPVFAPWPELADISICNKCSKNCSFCYRDSTPDGKCMSAEEYAFVLECLTSPEWGSVFQVALGGGEPLENPQFTRIIDITHQKGVVTNFTTNGLHLDNAFISAIKDKVGALALSLEHFADLDEKTVKKLNDQGIRVNIHYILNQDSVEEASRLLDGEFNKKLKRINGVVFLTYKPAGRGGEEKLLTQNSSLEKFISKIDGHTCPVNIGFDACFVPMLLCHTGVHHDIIDACECGFFSIYIDENMNVKPCSFSNDPSLSYSLEHYSMGWIWGTELAGFRNKILNGQNCSAQCAGKQFCHGKCTFFPEITLCYEP